MSAVLPPKKPARQPIKLSLPVQPSSSSSSSSSTTSPRLVNPSGSGPSTSDSGWASSSGAPLVRDIGASPRASSSGKPSLRLPSLAGLSLNDTPARADSSAGGASSSVLSSSRPRSVTSSGRSSHGGDEREDESDDYETDGGETKWAKGDHERITGDILNVIHGGGGHHHHHHSPSSHGIGHDSVMLNERRGSASTTSARPSTANSLSSQASESTRGAFDSRSRHRRQRGSTSGQSDDAGDLVDGDDGEADDELAPGQFEDLGKLGEGTSGTVRKVRHRTTGVVMAKKTIPTSPNPKMHKQHLRELLFMRDCRNEHIVEYYGAFLEDNDTSIGICMEYCEGGSLEVLYRRVKANGWRTGEKVLSKIAESILNGLVYLHSLKIIHRDIKPSNVLVSGDGVVKLCDFGVSGELINSLAGTFVGTTFYLSPERIRGHQYSINSDVWSMALTVLEVALNRFPFPAPGEAPLNGPIELLTYLSTMTSPPEIADEPENGIKYTKAFRHFIEVCLDKDPARRPSPQKLLTHAWIRRSIERDPPTSIWAWVQDIRRGDSE